MSGVGDRGDVSQRGCVSVQWMLGVYLVVSSGDGGDGGDDV